MNWSMIVCAPLAKSPNCASQRTSASGAAVGVAVLEPDARVLGERRVVDLERGLRALQPLHRDLDLAGDRVVEDEVAVGERAALGVLPGEPDGDPLPQQRGEGERLGVAPVDPALVERRRRDARAGAASFGLTVNPCGTGISCSVSRRSRFSGTPVSTAVATRDRDGLVVRLRRDLLAERRPQPVVRLVQPRGDGLDLSARASSSPRITPRSTSFVRVELAYRRVALDLAGHDRLRVRGLVLLVVAEAPVADQVDDDVVAEARAVGEREPDGRDRRLRVVGVDVDDRRVEALGEVGRVAGRPSLRRIGREPDLVVRDQVERAAGRVALERVEVERLGDDPLAGERSVAVQQDRHRDASGRVPRRASRDRSGRRGSSPRRPG